MLRRTLPVALLLFLALLAAHADASSYRDTDIDDTIKPPPDPRDTRPTPRLDLVLSREIAIPGPIAAGARADELGVEVPLGSGSWHASWTEIDDGRVGPDADAAPATPAASGADPGPVLSPNGRRRVTSLPDGWVLAEKKRRRKWRRDWLLRVAGRTVSPPAVTDDRVYFGATDNRVYAVKLKNGHRVWAADVDGRASRRPVLWRGPSPDGGEEVALLLIVPEHGSSLIVLDAAGGEEVASFRLDEQTGVLVGTAVRSPAGEVAVARQSYVDAEAALLVFELRPRASDAPGAVAYNPSAEPSAPADAGAPPAR